MQDQPNPYQTPPQNPTYPPTPIAPQTPNQAPVNATYPGKTLGIVGFIFAFVGLQLIGLILSIVGYKKSKQAGYKNTLAKVGIILNSIILVLAAILIPVMIALTMASYNGITKNANAAVSKNAASETVRMAEAFKTDNSGLYPSSQTDINSLNTSGQFTISTTPITSAPSTYNIVNYYTCGTQGIKVGYWDYRNSTVAYLYSGDATESSSCTLAP